MRKYLQRFRLKDCSSIKVTCLGVRCSELQLGPHGVHVGLAQHDQSSSTGLNGLYDLVWNHLADLIDNMIRDLEIC